MLFAMSARLRHCHAAHLQPRREALRRHAVFASASFRVFIHAARFLRFFISCSAVISQFHADIARYHLLFVIVFSAIAADIFDELMRH